MHANARKATSYMACASLMVGLYGGRRLADESGRCRRKMVMSSSLNLSRAEDK
jgi:hypothetical protein